MRGLLRWLTFSMAVLSILCANPLAAQDLTSSGANNTIVDLRVGLNPGRTRVVLDMTAPPDFRYEASESTRQLVFDIQATQMHKDLADIDLKGSVIRELSLQQRPGGTLRFTLQLIADVQPNLFPQAPYDQRGHRLVIDLTEKQRAHETIASGPPPAPTEDVANDTLPRATGNGATTEARDSSVTQIEAAYDIYTEWTGYIGIEARLFAHSPIHPDQDRDHGSIAFAPEFLMELEDGRQRFAVRPFMRYDFQDNERSHVDLRALYWQWEQQQWLVKAGVDVVFWGVAESQHLIDIINQTDAVENIDDEDRLGQPMLNVDYMTNGWGTWQAYILPWFRERTFPGRDGRLRTEPVVDTDDPVYESSEEEEHIDLALRWSHYLGDWDLGVAHFSGTSRTPLLLPATDGQNALIPLYLQIDQTSVDAQATKGAWLWKLEALYNSNKVEDYFAAVGGFEYTWFGAGGSAADIGWLLEYHYDERDERSQSAFQNDVYAGLRYSGNNLASTQILLGAMYDLDNDSVFGNLEASQRLGESWLLSLEARFFTEVDRQDPLWPLRKDDYLELQLQRYF